ncbi:YcnI family protein [Nocardioides sp. cx-173]|uniref:YcnI family copper-binding membrane protein n=1 Tax=Nocardioides sp. cx-173 TaxID=2898796 RepID=UPI001E31CC37|nr:YcnI family protein [Nocardioides sp. cx-173]MCD4524464.1 YcnI family protein [Nocardioides sp. cx-173]UGB43050.1 YcnI family protein [Nocardioides sp. cx-173]
MNTRTAARLGAPLAAAALLTLGLAAPASAHVTITPSETEAGASTVLTVSNGHGCEGSPTTGITIQMPEQINAVTPTRNPLYDVTKTMEKLPEPVTDAHGNEITERVATVVYTAKTPLPDGYRDTFELSVQLPDTPGETLAFPVIQTCEKGESAWVEVPAEGQDPDELERPAPTVTLTEADDADGSQAAAEEETSVEEADATDDDVDRDVVGYAAFAAALLGIVLGGIALARGRRSS